MEKRLTNAMRFGTIMKTQQNNNKKPQAQPILPLLSLRLAFLRRCTMKRWLTILLTLAMMVISGCEQGSGPDELTLSFGHGRAETDRWFGVKYPDVEQNHFGVSVTWYLNKPNPDKPRRFDRRPAVDEKRVKDGQDESDGS